MFTIVDDCIYICVFRVVVKVALDKHASSIGGRLRFGRYPKETICGLKLYRFFFFVKEKE